MPQNSYLNLGKNTPKIRVFLMQTEAVSHFSDIPYLAKGRETFVFDSEEMHMQFLNTDFLENEEIKLVVARLADENPERNWVPAYHFHICDLRGNIMGACDLRIGYTDGLYYGGHIGYSVKEEYRGHHYAAKACKLLFSLAKKHNMGYLYITCNPDNLPSRKTLEYLHGDFLGVVELPEGNDMRIMEGETHKCIFKFHL